MFFTQYKSTNKLKILRKLKNKEMRGVQAQNGFFKAIYGKCRVLGCFKTVEEARDVYNLFCLTMGVDVERMLNNGSGFLALRRNVIKKLPEGCLKVFMENDFCSFFLMSNDRNLRKIVESGYWYWDKVSGEVCNVVTGDLLAVLFVRATAKTVSSTDVVHYLDEDRANLCLENLYQIIF